MATNLNIPDTLMAEALRIGGLKTKRDTVIEALKEFVAYRRRVEVLKYKGKFDFDPTYDYKAERRRT